MIDIFISIFIIIGLFFTLSGSLGLWRFPDIYTRVHGPTKATTLGISSLVFASLLDFYFRTFNTGFTEILVILFLFITAPAAAHMIARAAIIKKLPRLDHTTEKMMGEEN